MLVNCFCCEKQFNKNPNQIRRSKSGNHFCSRSCAAKINNKGIQRNKAVTLTCNFCKSDYQRVDGHSSDRICKDCSDDRNQHKLMTLREAQSPEYLKNRHRSWINSRVRSFARTWNKELIGHSCQKCGYNKHTEFCHIKAISSFDLDAKLGEINSPKNIAILCRNCHWEFDHGELTIEQIPSR